MSLGKALVRGIPVVLTCSDRPPDVICEPGKEKEALELLEKMGIITITRPTKGIPVKP